MSRSRAFLFIPVYVFLGLVISVGLLACGGGGPGSGATTGRPVDSASPSEPRGLVATVASATATSGTTINLTWQASSDNVGVTGYIVKRNGTQVATPTAGSYSDTCLSRSTIYSYTVAALDAAGNLSSESAVASATTADTQFPLHTAAGKRCDGMKMPAARHEHRSANIALGCPSVPWAAGAARRKQPSL